MATLCVLGHRRSKQEQAVEREKAPPPLLLLLLLLLLNHQSSVGRSASKPKPMMWLQAARAASDGRACGWRHRCMTAPGRLKMDETHDAY